MVPNVNSFVELKTKIISLKWLHMNSNRTGLWFKQVNTVLFGNWDWLFYTSGLLSFILHLKFQVLRNPVKPLCCTHHQSETSAIYWSQHILVLRALRKHLNNKQKIKLMRPDHGILTLDDRLHIFISLSSSQSPPRAQVDS